MLTAQLETNTGTRTFSASFLDANPALVADIRGTQPIDAMTHSYSEAINQQRNVRRLTGKSLLVGIQEEELKTMHNYASFITSQLMRIPNFPEYASTNHIFFSRGFSWPTSGPPPCGYPQSLQS